MTISASPVFGQTGASKKKAVPGRAMQAKANVPRIGSEAVIVTFRDVATRAVGGPYGIVQKGSIPAIVEMAEKSDATSLKELSKFGELLVLAPGTRVLVGGLHQEMTEARVIPSAPSSVSLPGYLGGGSSAPEVEAPRPIGPPMAFVRVLDGPAKDRVLFVPLAYLAPPPKSPPAEATKGNATDVDPGASSNSTKGSTKPVTSPTAKPKKGQ
jgi:hypothetical protein